MKYLLLSIAAVTVMSCSSATGGGDQGKTAENKITDPVCGMQEEKDMQWTDYSLKGTDTVWFCSPHCKEQYDKDPAKYAPKQEK